MANSDCKKGSCPITGQDKYEKKKAAYEAGCPWRYLTCGSKLRMHEPRATLHLADVDEDGCDTFSKCGKCCAALAICIIDTQLPFMLC